MVELRHYFKINPRANISKYNCFTEVVNISGLVDHIASISGVTVEEAELAVISWVDKKKRDVGNRESVIIGDSLRLCKTAKGKKRVGWDAYWTKKMRKRLWQSYEDGVKNICSAEELS